VKYLIASNASGGVNPDFNVGDVMIIDDHINLLPDNPLRGKNYDELGPRFLDVLNIYDRDMISMAEQIAKKNNIQIRKGVYTAIQGPCYETPAEYKYMRTIGADTVGMSTIPEVIVAHHMKIKCFAISVITDLGVPGKIVEISHQEVIEVAKVAEKKVTKIVKDLVELS